MGWRSFILAAIAVTLAVVSLTTSGVSASDPDSLVESSVPGSIHGQKFNDLDADGVRDAGEPGLNGWTIELTHPDGTVTSLVTHSMDLDGDGAIDPITEQGLFWFTDLPPGTYDVSEVQQAGWLKTLPSGSLGTVFLSSGQILEVKFGNHELGSLRGQKFNDLDADGVRDAGEPGLDGWTIELTYPDGTITSQVTHSSDLNGDGVIDPVTEQGLFWFMDLPSGTYDVSEVQQAGWLKTLPSGEWTVFLSSGQILEVTFANHELGSIHGQKWHDLDADGVRDAGEPGLDGWHRTHTPGRHRHLAGHPLQ